MFNNYVVKKAITVYRCCRLPNSKQTLGRCVLWNAREEARLLFGSVSALYRIMCVRIKYKKFELMLARRPKAYSSSCSQTVSLSPEILSQFIPGVCGVAEDRKNQ